MSSARVFSSRVFATVPLISTFLENLFAANDATKAPTSKLSPELAPLLPNRCSMRGGSFRHQLVHSNGLALMVAPSYLNVVEYMWIA